MEESMEYTPKSIILKQEKEMEDVEVAVDAIDVCTEHINAQVKEDFKANGSKNARALAKLSKQYRVFLKYYNMGCFSIDLKKFQTLNSQALLQEIPAVNEVCEKRFGKLQEEEKQR